MEALSKQLDDALQNLLDNLEVTVKTMPGPGDTTGVMVSSNTEPQLPAQVMLRILLVGLQGLSVEVLGEQATKEDVLEFLTKEIKEMPEGAPAATAEG